jgi:hypothetical protein
LSPGPIQRIALGRRVEQVLFIQRARGDEVDALFTQPMNWSVQPDLGGASRMMSLVIGGLVVKLLGDGGK